MTYRIYRLNAAGSIDGPPKEIESADEEVVLRLAARIADMGFGAEVWQMERLVCALPSRKPVRAGAQRLGFGYDAGARRPSPDAATDGLATMGAPAR